MLSICKANSGYTFSKNKSDLAVQICINNHDLIDWMGFSENESSLAVQHCRENINKVSWGYMLQNKSPEAKQLCGENLESIKEYWRIAREISMINF